MTPPPTATCTAAQAKLTQRELAALRAELRRELRAEVEAEHRARRERNKRNRGELDTPQLAAAARRMVAAVGRKAALDVEGLTELAALRDVVDAELTAAVAAARDGGGLGFGARYSWADVGRVLGMTRQAAQQRFGRAAVDA